MDKRIFKFSGIAVILGITAFFTFPMSFPRLFPTEEFPPEPPVVLISDAQNHGERCREDTIYVARRNEGDHLGEGYDFIVDDHCAGLQKALIAAIESENIDEIRALIARGANVRGRDVSNIDATYPLQIAALKNYRTLKLILDNGADPNSEYCCCAFCQSPLVSAVDKGDPETVRLLLERGADINYIPRFSDDPYTILGIAWKKPEILSLLVNACDQTLACRVKYRVARLNELFDKKIR